MECDHCHLSQPATSFNSVSPCVLQDGTWGVSYLVGAELRHRLEVAVCPPDYCQCRSSTEGTREICRNVYRHLDPNYQCKCNRNGEGWGRLRKRRGATLLVPHASPSLHAGYILLCNCKRSLRDCTIIATQR